MTDLTRERIEELRLLLVEHGFAGNGETADAFIEGGRRAVAALSLDRHLCEAFDARFAMPERALADDIDITGSEVRGDRTLTTADEDRIKREAAAMALREVVGGMYMDDSLDRGDLLKRADELEGKR